MRCNIFITVWIIFFKSFPVSKCVLLFLLLPLRIRIGTEVEHQIMDQGVQGSPPALSSFLFFVFWQLNMKKLIQMLMKTFFEFDEINSKVWIKKFKVWIKFSNGKLFDTKFLSVFHQHIDHVHYPSKNPYYPIVWIKYYRQIAHVGYIIHRQSFWIKI